MKLVISTLIFIAGVSVFAGPQFEPGPALSLDEVSNEAIDALVLAKAAHLKTFIKSGNTTKEVSRQMLSPGVTAFTFLRQQCQLGGFAAGSCLGGSSLKVVVTEKHSGDMITIEATSTLNLIR